MKNFIKLESVGSWFDPETDTIYPSFRNGLPDLDSPMPLLYCILEQKDEGQDEWWNSLSRRDHDLIYGFIQDSHSRMCQ